MFIKSSKYELEFIHEMNGLLPGWYGQRGTHTQGVDVFLIKGLDRNRCAAIRIEAKSSRFKNMSLKHRAKEYEQYTQYLEMWKKYRIMTFYAFRVKGPDKQWKVFPIDRLPRTRNGTPKLDIRKGMTLERFAEIVGK